MFDQVWILWGLPLVLLPVLIHLLNRLRFRSVDWAAMVFLLAATRRSTRQARVRQILVLLCRMLALALLIFAISRPLVGGWLGLTFSGPPETILLLLDRSASMEMQHMDTNMSKREHALQLIAMASAQQAGDARIILIDSATCTPQEVSNIEVLPELPTTQATGTAADFPAMLQAALDYLLDHDTGKTEIWLISDLQESNWQPGNAAWETLMAQFNSLKRAPQFRLLAMPSLDVNNRAVSIRELNRLSVAEQDELQITFDLMRSETAPADFPVTIRLEQEQPETRDINMESHQLRLQQRVLLGRDKKRGWGRISIPGDRNPADNEAWFVYDEAPERFSLVVTEAPLAGRFLMPAAAVVSEVEVRSPENWQTVDLQRISLILWQGNLPSGEPLKGLSDFVNAGGVLLIFPPTQAGGKIFDTLSWGPLQTAASDTSFSIAHWNRQDGPLADTASGWTLPLDSLDILRRRTIVGDAESIAEFADGSSLFTRLRLGHGQVLVCATLPAEEWSDLQYSTLFMPLIQRLIQSGSKRLSPSRMLFCGEFIPDENAEWRPVSGSSGNPRWSAGIFESGSQRIALNRPPAENAVETVEREAVMNLFGAVRFRMFEEQHGQGQQAMPSEIWRLLIYLMLFILLIESLLTLPARLNPELKEASHAA